MDATLRGGDAFAAGTRGNERMSLKLSGKPERLSWARCSRLSMWTRAEPHIRPAPCGSDAKVADRRQTKGGEPSQRRSGEPPWRWRWRNRPRWRIGGRVAAPEPGFRAGTGPTA